MHQAHVMLLKQLEKKRKEKPVIDWAKYCEWRIQNYGSIWEPNEPPPNIWKCSCGQVNTSAMDARYAKCTACGLIYPGCQK